MKILSILLLFPVMIFATANYELIGDINFSPYAGAHDVISLYNGVINGRDQAFPSSQPPKTKALACLGRFAEMGLLWEPLSHLARVSQHEVCGHGYRIRDIGPKFGRVTGYEVSCSGGGVTKCLRENQATLGQCLAVTIAGLEAERVLVDKIKDKWLAEQKIDGRLAILYLNSQLSMGYQTNGESGDLDDYVKDLNIFYPSYSMTAKDIQYKSLVNLFLDPFSYYSMYAWFNYVLKGEKGSVPMLKFNHFSFLPRVKFELAPYGAEYTVESNCFYNNKPFTVYLKGGEYGGNHFFGFGFNQQNLIAFKRATVGVKFDFWKQPEFQYDYYLDHIRLREFPNKYKKLVDEKHFSIENSKDDVFGVALSLSSRIRLFEEKTSTIFLYSECGYKTKGYLAGYSLKEGLISRFGLTMSA